MDVPERCKDCPGYKNFVTKTAFVRSRGEHDMLEKEIAHMKEWQDKHEDTHVLMHKDMRGISDKLDKRDRKFQWWLIGILGTLVAGFALAFIKGA